MCVNWWSDSEGKAELWGGFPERGAETLRERRGRRQRVEVVCVVDRLRLVRHQILTRSSTRTEILHDKGHLD